MLNDPHELLARADGSQLVGGDVIVYDSGAQEHIVLAKGAPGGFVLTLEGEAVMAGTVEPAPVQAETQNTAQPQDAPQARKRRGRGVQTADDPVTDGGDLAELPLVE